MRLPAVSRFLGLVGWLAFGGLSPEALAHEGPEHEIEELSRRMAMGGESADLLLERAIEYRTLGRWAEAATDLRRAARLAPADPLLLRELAQAQIRGGRPDEAMATLRQALRIPGLPGPERAAILMIRCEAHAIGRDWRRALADCEEALRNDPMLVAAYLERSTLQQRLGRARERIVGLEAGVRRTGAGVLAVEQVEALLDDRQWRKALGLIEPEVESARLTGTWKIRRARALLGLGRRAEAEADLRHAIGEIDRRMPADRPEAALLLDRALAWELLGESGPARADYTAATEAGAGEAAAAGLRRLRPSGSQRAVRPSGRPGG